MSYRLRISAWVVGSCALLLGIMIYTGYSGLEEELRAGRVDRNHPRIPGWTLHNSLSEEEIQDILGELMRIWLITAAVIIPLSLGAGLLLARRSLLPVREINRQLAAMRPDALHGDIAIPEADPAIARLADHLNILLGRAGTAYREMAEFSARVAHELRTPLMLLRLRLENAPAGMPPVFLEELHDELARLTRFVERSLLAAKSEQGTLQVHEKPCDLGNIVHDLADSYLPLAAERGLAMTAEAEPGVEISADADLLRQALHGLLDNAARYAGTRLSIACRGGATPAVEIGNDRDPHCVPPAGTGLGLRLVQGICKACGWTFESRGSEHDFHASIRFPTPKPPIS